MYSIGTYLKEHGEINNGNGGSNEHGLKFNMIRVDEKHEGKGHRSPKASVRHYELIHPGKFVQSEMICDPGQQKHT